MGKRILIFVLTVMLILGNVTCSIAQELPMTATASENDIAEVVSGNDAESTDMPEAISDSDTESTDMPEAISDSDAESTDMPEAISDSDTEKTDMPKAISDSDTEKTDMPEAISDSDTEKTDMPKAISDSDTEKTVISDGVLDNNTEESDIANSALNSQSDAIPEDAVEEKLVFTNREQLNQAMRSQLVNRASSFCFYVPQKLWEEWQDDANNPYAGWPSYSEEEYLEYMNWGWSIDKDVLDFYAEREGMAPYEGDYLWHTVVSYLGEEGEITGADGTVYVELKYSDIKYKTGKTQEEWVNEKVNSLVKQSGGALYPYRNATDLEKVNAICQYITDNVSYVDTATTVFQTCYSALHNKEASREGFAMLFYRLAREMGIGAKVIMGEDSAKHTWNLVKLDNQYYHLDCLQTECFLLGKTYQPAELQTQYLTNSFQAAYLNKVAAKPYGGEKLSAVLSISNLTNAQVQAVDANLVATADKMSVGTYAITDRKIKASEATLEYLAGCSAYVGYGASDNTATEGHFLAFRVKVEKAKLTQQANIQIVYTVDDEQYRKTYTYTDSTLRDGYVDTILNVTKDVKDISVIVDFDSALGSDSIYQTVIYSLDISDVKKNTPVYKAGKITAAAIQGVEESTPLVMETEDGLETPVVYEYVAFSGLVQIPGREDTVKGNYVALKIDVPECMKNTALIQNTTITIGDKNLISSGDEQAYAAWDEKYRHIYLVMKAVTGEKKTVTICWGGTQGITSLIQKVPVEISEKAYLESVNENAVLPKSIVFQNVVPTMYIGEKQYLTVNIAKQHEDDVNQIVFSSNAPEIASVNRVTGEVKAFRTGTAMITVSAIDHLGRTTKPLTKNVKLTVKELAAPVGCQILDVKDTSATVSWKTNTTGQYIEVYAIVLDIIKMGENISEWGSYIEKALSNTVLDKRILSDMTEEEHKIALQELRTALKTDVTALAYVTDEQTKANVKGIHPETEYVFYVRNVAKTASGEVTDKGSVTNCVVTKSRIFDSISVLALSEKNGTAIESTVTEEEKKVYIVSDDTFTDKVTTPAYISYQLLYGTVPAKAEFTQVKYISTNPKVVKIAADGKVTLGGEAGKAEIYVTGNDSSGTHRESERIVMKVLKKPTSLKDKTIKMTIGDSVSVKDIIGYNTKGTTDELYLDSVDFAAALEKIKETGCFVITYPASGTTSAQDAMITAAEFATNTNGVRKAGNQIAIPVTLRNMEGQAISTKTAKIRINDMTAAVIQSVTPKDTTATIRFTPSVSLKAKNDAQHYYTVHVTDKVTKREKTLSHITFGEYDAKTGLISCKVEGLQSNRAYKVVITAHYDADAERKNEKASRSKDFVTKKPLLTTEGSIEITYSSLADLKTDPYSTGIKIDYAEEKGIVLVSGEDYVFLAQVSNLARVLETDKLKWSISSGDTRAATIKASASTFEARLKPVKTGTFTVSATSTATKEVLATFKVTVIPFQAKDNGTAANHMSDITLPDVALLAETTYMLKKEQKGDKNNE